MNPPWWLLVVTSAAVGSLAAAIVTLIGQGLERRARRDELLLSKAIEMAAANTARVIAVAKEQNRSVTLYPDVMNARDYFVTLRHILEHQALPPDLHAKIEAQNIPIDDSRGKRQRELRTFAEAEAKAREARVAAEEKEK